MEEEAGETERMRQDSLGKYVGENSTCLEGVTGAAEEMRTEAVQYMGRMVR